MCTVAWGSGGGRRLSLGGEVTVTGPGAGQLVLESVHVWLRSSSRWSVAAMNGAVRHTYDGLKTFAGGMHEIAQYYRATCA